MNIPEGWKLVPEKETHEMRSAFRESEKGALLSGHDHIEAFYCAYRAMLAAAPTPPAQEDEPLCPRPCNGRPDNTTMAECILAGECGCTVKGHKYAQRKAQEAEPVAWIILDWSGDRRGFETRPDAVEKLKESGCELIPLYTRPDNSVLRKAAGEAVAALEPYDDIKPRDWVTDREKLRAAYANLRAALEGK